MNGFFQKLGLLMFAPVVAAHEYTHVLASKPWANDAHVQSWLPPRVVISYPSDASWAGVRFANLAPTLTGILIVPFISVFAMSVSAPLGVIIMCYWLIYTWPSKQDISPSIVQRD